MQIIFTPEVETFLKARFETVDIAPIVQLHVDNWVNHLVDVAYSRAPAAANKIAAATADIIVRTGEADIRKAERESLNNRKP